MTCDLIKITESGWDLIMNGIDSNLNHEVVMQYNEFIQWLFYLVFDWLSPILSNWFECFFSGFVDWFSWFTGCLLMFLQLNTVDIFFYF